MIHIYKDYFCDADGASITLYERKTVLDSKKAKTENIGKERFTTVGFYTDLSSMLKGIIKEETMRTISDNKFSELYEVVKENIRMIDELANAVVYDKIDEKIKEISAEKESVSKEK